MGQAVVDLPDPLEKQPASASSADDLLSQLAGDEIDRLLTEADVENADAATTPLGDAGPESATLLQAESKSADVTPAVDASAVHRPAIDTAGDQQVAAQIVATHPLEPGAANASHSTEAIDPADLDKVLSGSTSAAPSTEATAEPIAKVDIDQTLAAEADAKLAPHTADLKQDAAVDAAVDAAEAAALAAPIAAAAEAHPSDAEEREGLLATVAAESTDDDLNAPLPLWLRPLEWLNAPMDAFSDDVRSFLGKAAILTLVNSAAVIIYVMMFRRH